MFHCFVCKSLGILQTNPISQPDNVNNIIKFCKVWYCVCLSVNGRLSRFLLQGCWTPSLISLGMLRSLCVCVHVCSLFLFLILYTVCLFMCMCMCASVCLSHSALSLCLQPVWFCPLWFHPVWVQVMHAVMCVMAADIMFGWTIDWIFTGFPGDNT